MSLAQLASTLTQLSVMDAIETEAMDKVGALVEDTAKHAIGTYELGWTPLKPETIARKANGDTPLLESGEMRDSIGHVTQGRETSIGSNDQVAVYQELGTAKIPPRSFLQGSAIYKETEIKNIIGSYFYQHMIIG